MLRLINIVLLLVWAALLLWLITFGKSDLIRLLHPRLWWVLGVAVVVLSVFLLSLIISYRQTEKKNLIMELPGVLILLIPIMYLAPATEARLDGSSLHNRIIKDDTGTYFNNLPSFEIFKESKSIDMSFAKILREPQEYEDQEVEVVCQSFVNEQLPENTAMCYRYFITCCAADALPAFIFLSHESELEIENNRWIKVNGPVSIIRNNDMEFPSVKVGSFEYVEEPFFPWAM